MAEDDDGTVLTASQEGIFGLQEVVADFDVAELERLREVARTVRTVEQEGVRSAIALAGSAAQSKFQLFPGDCDLFERVHLEAPTREAALKLLALTMVQTVANVFPHPRLQFSEMKLGLHPADAQKGDTVVRKGEPISWNLTDLDARAQTVQNADGDAIRLELGASENPGFVKLDWIHADAERDRIVWVSKVIDATWQAPDGTVTPLDGIVDSFYQEVYLEDETRPFVEQLIDKVTPSGLGDYVGQLEKEIRKYTSPGHENYGKVAKRLYNIYRITNKQEQVLRLRELFDDPAARLYQVQAVVYALQPVLGGVRLEVEAVRGQLQEVEDILNDCYKGADVEELVALVGDLPNLDPEARRTAMTRLADTTTRSMSEYFKAELERDPAIASYLTSLAAPPE